MKGATTCNTEPHHTRVLSNQTACLRAAVNSLADDSRVGTNVPRHDSRTITDPNDAVVAGATVTVKNTSTGLERSTDTDYTGNYTVPELPIGPYGVRVEQPGFVTAVVSNTIVEVASERRVDVKLVVAGAQNLVLIAPTMQVETTTASRQT
jgi:hypothetical protein